MYAALARSTRGLFHVKTAGTSYLEALRVVARHEEPLLRELVDFSRSRYETDRATYHLSATLESALPPSEIESAAELEKIYLEMWDDVPTGKGFTYLGRQILHCTFGSVLTDERYGPLVHDILKQHPDTYREVLADHFVRHLDALQSGM